MSKRKRKQLKLKLPQFFKDVWQKSQTVYLSVFQVGSAGVLFGASELHDILSNSEVKDVLGQLTLPHWFPAFLLALSILTYIAHGHKDA